MRQCLQAEKRFAFKRSGLNRLRREGKVPAIVYGKHIEENVPILVAAKDVQRWALAGHLELIDLQINEVGTYPVILTDIQRDPLSGEWLHADFHQVKLDEPVKAKVPLELTGAAPGVKAGGVLQVAQTHVEVEALPADVPAMLQVDISGLQVGHHLSVSDIRAAGNVRILSDADEVIVSIVAPRTGKDADGDSAAAADAE